MTDAVRAVRDAVPTSRHARMLFKMVEDLLGESAYVESAAEGTQLRLYRRSGHDYVPWPILSLSTTGRLSQVFMIRGPEEPPAPQGRKRRLRNLGPGEVIVHQGPESIAVTYGDGGRWFETSVHGDPLPGVAEALEHGATGPTERLAELVAGLDHGRAMLHMPVPLPGVLCGVWAWGRRAIRHALFHGRVPDDARWVAADGYDGVAVGWGATRDEALARWRGEVERLRPSPLRPAGPDQSPPPGATVVQAPPSDGEMPDPAPENTPAAILPLEPPPSRPPGFGEWTRLVGDYGFNGAAGRRQDVAGFTLVGDRAMEALGDDGLERLDESLAQIETPGLTMFPDRKFNCVTVFYRLLDERTGLLDTPRCETRRSDGFDPGMLDADLVRWCAVRQRWRDLE